MSRLPVKVTQGKLVSTSNIESNADLLSGVVDWLQNLSSVFDEQSREINKVTGISRNEVLVIRVVSRSPTINVSELARRMQMNKVTMVRILDRLERRELITRTRSCRDRRVVEIMVTAKAEDIDLMLGNITHDILKCCLGAANEVEFIDKLEPLHKFTEQFKSTSYDTSHFQTAVTAKGKV